MPSRTTPVGGAIVGQQAAAATMNGAAGGWIGHAEVTVGQNTVTVGGDVDLTGLTIAVTVGSSRRIRVMAVVSLGDTAAQQIELRLKEGATQLAKAIQNVSAGGNAQMVVVAILTPTAGAHTYKVAYFQNAAGTLVMTAAATQPATLLVEDLGPA